MRTLWTLFALCLSMLVAAPTAVAPPDHAAQTENFTAQDVAESFLDVNPCTGEEAVIDLLYNFAFHVTEWTDGPRAGQFRVTGTLTGDVDITPTDPAGTAYSGHFTIWFGGAETSNTGVFTETFQVKLTGDDDSKLKGEGVSHVTFANGELRTAFSTFECR